MYYCVTVIEDGGPGWLNLLVLLLSWNALKFLVIGPVSLARLRSGEMRELTVAELGELMDSAQL